MTTTISKDALVAAVVALAEAGIPTDTQELLLQGDPMRGIKPSALQSAIMSALSTLKPPEATTARKPFTFADPARQIEHEKHKAACGNNVDKSP